MNLHARLPIVQWASQLWWDKWPDIYQREIDALDNAGLEYVIDEEAKQSGQLVIKVLYNHEGQNIRLEAKYPAYFPFFRFLVYAPELSLPRHQNPLDGQLCLIPKSTIYWHQSDTLAQYVQERVPHMINVATSTDKDYMRQEEEPQGEPFSAYFGYQPGEGILIRSQELPPDIKRGVLTLGINHQTSDIGAVLAVKDEHGAVLWEAGECISKRFPRHVKGRWTRMGQLPANVNLAELFNAVLLHEPKFAQEQFDGWHDIIAVVFPEEVQQEVLRDGWMFFGRMKDKHRPGNRRVKLMRALRAGPEDFSSRIPELSPMSSKKIAVFGLGCLGAPSALQFARNGVGELRLLDFDFIEPGSTVRWPFGLPNFGKQKSHVLREQLELNYPYTKVTHEDLMIGHPMNGPKEMEVLDRMLDGASLVYDATSEWGINIFLAHLARERGIPYIWISATNGAWGGITGRIVPGLTEGCFSCFGYHLQDGEFCPSEKPGGLHQPVGCADPTFTGSSFDTETIALAGVRLAISTLCRDTKDAYPDMNLDVGVVNLREMDGHAIAPDWNCKSLTKHASCPQHG